MNLVDVAEGFREIMAALKTAGIEAKNPMVAGGVVRDAIMGLEPNDWDFYATDYNAIADGGYLLHTYQLAGLMRAAGFESIGVDGSEIPSVVKAYGTFQVGDKKVNILRTVSRHPWDHFDFVCCIGAYDGVQFHNISEAATDITDGTLAINTTALKKEQRWNTIHRADEFEARYGWQRSRETARIINGWKKANA